MWDLERLQEPVYSAQANSEMIYSVDACGGQVCTIAMPTLLSPLAPLHRCLANIHL